MTPHWLFPKGALTHIVLLIFICFVGLLLVLQSSPPLNRSKLTLRATGRAAAYDVTKNRDIPAGDHGAHSRPWMPRFANLLQFRPMPSQRNHERGLAGR